MTDVGHRSQFTSDLQIVCLPAFRTVSIITVVVMFQY